MRRLIPAGPDASLDAAVDLTDAYAYPSLGTGEHWLRANMIASVDGVAVDSGGGSRGLSGPADRRVLGALRRLADVILVGAGTVRAEPEAYRPVESGPGVRRRRTAAGQAETPVVAIVTESLDLDFTSSPFVGARPLVVTSAAAPPDRLALAREAAEVVVAGASDPVDLAAAMRELTGRGLPRVLCEGGPRLLGAIAAAGLLDELCLTISPQLAGTDGSRRILAGLPAALPLRLVQLLEEDGFLFTRYARRDPGPIPG